MEQFRKLGIIEPILEVIQEEGFDKPTEIQEKTIPLVVAGKDVIGGAATGSGKTLAFGVGIIQHCERGRGLQTLVLTPTRELAEQNAKALVMFSRYKPLSIAAVYGGVSINPQIDALRTADVVVGTPGRLLDHMERQTIRLAEVKILVLDEADRMLDMGFIDDVERIIKACPSKRQTMLFSATIPFEVSRLSERYMTSPVKVDAVAHVDPKKLTQVYYNIPKNQKFSLLTHLLKHEKARLVMVFCNSRWAVDFVERNLKENGVDAVALHGGLTQDRRNKIMEQFHNKKVRVLVCTDVAARGLDINGVSQVYNYDIPNEAKQYIHRIGRTARAGKEGKAINILCPEDFENFTAALREHDVDVDNVPTPRFQRARVRTVPRRFDGPHRAGRPGFGRGPRRPGRGPSRRSGPRSHRPHRR